MTNLTDNNDNKPGIWSKNDWILLAANAAIFIALFLAFNHRLPEIVASHYNVNGEADRTMAKWSFWLLNAALTIALPALLSVMRYVDPRKRNYARFESYYYVMRWAISLFLHSVLVLMILDNIGYTLPMLNLLVGGMGLLWIVIGNRMGQVRSNFFIGIRTPWALMDERNWRLTHRLGGRIWFVAGIVMFLSAWLAPEGWSIGILLTCALVSALVPAFYSYLIFRKNSRD
ncbi:SdpI family protein [Cohnella cellulosilytica]|uniref:SdpI family protein n=1 Tax=Cohnella cellulosilytica TaxID=986710 RepID=A0ABW2FN50_9BACL